MKNIARIVELDGHDVVCVREGLTAVKFLMAVDVPGAIYSPNITKEYDYQWVVDHFFGVENPEMDVAGDGEEMLREEAQKILDECLKQITNFILHEEKLDEDDQQPSFTCPNCGMTTHNPNDIREKYCGACQTFPEDRERLGNNTETVLVVEPLPKLTYEEFLATKRSMSMEEYRTEFDDPDVEFEEDTHELLVYYGGTYISRFYDSGYHLFLEHSQYYDQKIEPLEKLLYEWTKLENYW